MTRAALALGCALAVGAGALAAPECPAPSGSVRVMLHESAVIGGRLALYANATGSPTERVATLRKLFEAAACPQIAEHGEGKDRNIECILPGAGTETVIVGAGQTYDSAGTAALLASLEEALAAVPRRNTFRFVAFSSHESNDAERTGQMQKPKGAMRLIDAMTDAEKSLVRAMIHIGPVGFGPVWTHPPDADDRLTCAFEAAAEVARVPRSAPNPIVFDCARSGHNTVHCDGSITWAGGNDWQPFRRAGIRVFGVHSGSDSNVGGKLDGKLYFSTYRMLAIFLALADDALAPGAHAAPAASGVP